MNYSKKKLTLMAGLCLTVGIVSAQTPSDAVMMAPGEICFGVNYVHNAWDEYWEGDSLRDNGNIGTLTTHIFNGGFMLGVMDRLNIMVGLPYVITSPSAGVVSGDQGLQDAGFFLKALLLEKKVGKGNLKTLASAGYITPASNYVPDAPFAIGLGCPDGIFRGIVHYDADMGMYGRVDAAYHLRGNAFLQRSYYYTTTGYYTDEVDMPNAVDYNVTLGYITPNKHFKAEGVLTGITTFDGFDIRRQDGAFPSNDIEALRVGINADYYDLFLKGLAVHVTSAFTLTGSNIGKSTIIGGGISYQFHLWEPKSSNASSTPKAQ